MATVYRVTAVWQGFAGAPGYSKFSFSDLTDATLRNAAGERVRVFFDALKARFQMSWSIQVQAQIDEFDLSTGVLTGSSAMTTPPAVVQGTATTAAYAGGSGVALTWNTGLVLSGRRVRGRTFLVPFMSAFDNDGTLTTGTISLVGGAATTFIGPTAPRPSVWAKQWNGASPPVQVGGSIAPIDSYTLKDMASQLRSRRL